MYFDSAYGQLEPMNGASLAIGNFAGGCVGAIDPITATELATTIRRQPASSAACTILRVPATLISIACSSVHQPSEPAKCSSVSNFSSLPVGTPRKLDLESIIIKRRAEGSNSARRAQAKQIKW